jgi:alpha-galactosidase
MQGALGIGSNLNKWSDEDFALATRMVTYYKSIRETVQDGDLYRLSSPREGNLTANEYVAADGKQAVVFAFLHSQQFGRPAPTIYLRGLDEGAQYRVKGLDNKLTEKAEVMSGSFLMHHGLNFDLTGDFDCTSVVLERVP